MFLSRRTLHAALFGFLLVFLLSCGSAHDSDEFYVLVSANVQVPYWKTAGAGFANAASGMKVRSDFEGPQTFEVLSQLFPTFDHQIDQWGKENSEHRRVVTQIITLRNILINQLDENKPLPWVRKMW